MLIGINNISNLKLTIAFHELHLTMPLIDIQTIPFINTN